MGLCFSVSESVMLQRIRAWDSDPVSIGVSVSSCIYKNNFSHFLGQRHRRVCFCRKRIQIPVSQTEEARVVIF